ncbi:putative ubiquitin-RnfH superfamily antitoxin RatB of RatAB toxin-antitoxin module [Variovorax sp. TBS-050B]|uniref:RnfH family protein n=1 Tax=Variovorax sp. TBS-050B TaxID=2940551 RepID=UPI002473D712|nr:RnfH family protein [Variovorax sp. TBS-050B]MDH6594430.1 putative ubiquitin-RnfH superfamily antitoxin RatB of RatAB toxin-antitoxin module [Variovorax sp. TBS-050B]
MIEVTLSCSTAPREVFEQVLQLAPGATVADAVHASELAARFPQLDWRHAMTPGVWGREAAWEQPLKDGDRVELCRPLAVDPKVARRERFQRQGARGTGLFANRRKGGKAGY